MTRRAKPIFEIHDIDRTGSLAHATVAATPSGGVFEVVGPAQRDCLGPRLVLLGAPGSGKGTQGAALAHHFEIPHVSSGDLLRAHIAAGDGVGCRIERLIAGGVLVPDDLVVEVVRGAIASAESAGGYVLDGFPRTVVQATRARDFTSPQETAFDVILFLDVSDDTARKRLARRTDADRDDDADLAAIDRRIAVFHAETFPVLEFYEQRLPLVFVNADNPAVLVTAAILQALVELQKRALR